MQKCRRAMPCIPQAMVNQAWSNVLTVARLQSVYWTMSG
eukprot:CAMPEP_0185799104 /NCGR_PEP_ID=MMETSP1322-20130828/118_1 /TAXON_ID=265543 /ORGANISM="Minutocellus polymorphus, Strain RCC2270" /LENGTH=38 /DNA_ID= /DNA_START= /DNA_END= /DNA_ORIENTATION=